MKKPADRIASTIAKAYARARRNLHAVRDDLVSGYTYSIARDMLRPDGNLTLAAYFGAPVDGEAPGQPWAGRWDRGGWALVRDTDGDERIIPAYMR